MKSFIYTILKFSALSLVAYLLLVILWGSFAPTRFKKNLNYNLGGYGHMYTRMQEIKKVEDVDILLLGSSHAYRGVDPRKFEEIDITLFNAGSSAQSPIHSELILKRYLNKLNPQLIIIEVYPGTFGLDGVEASIDFVSNDKNDWQSFKMIVFQNHIKLYNTFIYSFFRDLMGLNHNFVEDPIKEHDTYVKGGYVMKQMEYYQHRKHEPRAWEFRNEQFKAFERIIKLSQEQQIELVFIQAPITQSLYSAHTNNREFDELMQNYGTYYNFNYLMNLDDSLHFYDAHHLNQHGVELFNAKVIEVLKNDGHLPN